MLVSVKFELLNQEARKIWMKSLGVPITLRKREIRALLCIDNSILLFGIPGIPLRDVQNLPIWSLHFNFIMVLLDSAAHIAWHNLDQLGLSRVSWWTRQGGNQKKRNENEKPTEQRQELLNYGPQGHRFVREPLLCSLRVESTSHGVWGWCWCCTVLMWKDGNKTCQNNQENDAALDYVEHPTAS